MFEKVLFKNRRDDGRPTTFDEYRASGGYAALETALKKMKPADVVQAVKDSGLRGRGGAGFPAGVKWASVAARGKPDRPVYLLPNVDEMEPGTFKDRILVNADPHLVIEGIVLSAYALQAKEAFFFVRPSYDAEAVVIEKEIETAREAGFLGKNILGSGFDFDIVVHRSAGRYICGESTAQVHAIMGDRPNPIKIGKHLTERGLWDSPTVVNNVETLSLVPSIVSRGVEWFKGLGGSPTGDGTKLYCLSGKVARPDCYELPMGSRLGDVLYETGGGMLPRTEFKAALPGGASTVYMTEAHYNTHLDFESMKKAGLMLGTGCIMVFDKSTCLVAATINLMDFFCRESCGFCTPCREGLPYIRHLLTLIERGEGREEHVRMLDEMSGILHHAYCAFALGAAAPLQGLLRHFRDEVMQHISERGCPFGNTHDPEDRRVHGGGHDM